MLRSSLPAALVTIVRIDLRQADRAEAEQHTEAIKRLVIEAREAEQPGHAFLAATGFWPTAQQVEAMKLIGRGLCVAGEDPQALIEKVETEASGGCAMSNFTKDANGWCEYFTVVQPEPGRPCGRDAFGLAGPFAQQEEAEQARDLIALHRDGKIGVMRCTFDADNGDLFENLAELQQSARRFIACLRVKSLASKSEEDA